jgi:membrane dipeptidase
LKAAAIVVHRIGELTMPATRREMLAGIAATATFGAKAGPARAAAGYDKARYDRAIVIDGLGAPDDLDGKEGVLKLSPKGLAQLRASGMTAWNITVGDVGNAPTNWENTLSNIAQYGRLTDANPDALIIARTAADIRAAKAAGKVALVMGTQDTAMAGTDLDRLDILGGLGVRIVQLTYNLRNLSGDGALEPANGGLSKLGRKTIEHIEANRRLLDLSHGGQRTIAEAIAAAKRPMTISHTGCRSLNDHPRNVWDAELKAMAAKGGVVGIFFMPYLVANSKPATADVVRHLTHAVDVCGEDHVGIGTDGTLSKVVLDDTYRANFKKLFDTRAAQGFTAPGDGPDTFLVVNGLNDPMRFLLLAQALDSAGWPAARIDKILGGNVLRLYGEAWGA